MVISAQVSSDEKFLLQKANIDLPLRPNKSLESAKFVNEHRFSSLANNEATSIILQSYYYQNNLTDALDLINENRDNLDLRFLILENSIFAYLRIKKDNRTSNGNTLYRKSEQITSLISKESKNYTLLNDIIEELLSKVDQINKLTFRSTFLMYIDYFSKIDNNKSEFLINRICHLYQNDPEFDIINIQRLLKNKKNEEATVSISKLEHEKIRKSSNVQLKNRYYTVLSDYYNFSQQIDLYKQSAELRDSLYKLLSQSRVESRAHWMKLEENHLKSDIDDHSKKNKYIYIILFSFFGSVVVFLLSKMYLADLSRKRYTLFLEKMENLSKKRKPISDTITEKTEASILSKLDGFEKGILFTNHNISLQSLAKELDTNTKYLSEIIKKHKNMNFSSYVNEQRIVYIVKKLKEDKIYRSYKIKYLAEESGFSTHSLFGTAFKNVMGVSPMTFIKFLNEKND